MIGPLRQLRSLAVQILRIELQRFRRFEHFKWHPRPGINCLIGPGDAGKTTVLEAIGRALSPAPAGPASEHDYYRRKTEDGFELELVLGKLSDELLGAFRPPALWGWQGPRGEMLDAPVMDAEPVMRLLVHGTADLETEHRLLLPNGEEINFSADKRRLLGLCRVGEMRGSSREFRMARGSLLERTLGREDIRGAAARAVRDASVDLQLPEEVNDRLIDLQGKLEHEGVTAEALALELLSPPGQSLLGLLGLAAGTSGEAIPLAFSGQGAQRIASFVLATHLQSDPPLLLMDEVEYGLEPYRRRLLIQRIRERLDSEGQAFLTTHSSTVLAELHPPELSRLFVPRDGTAPRMSPLPEALQKVGQRDPEALICRLPIVCEGNTEIEMLLVLLGKLAKADRRDLAAMGVRLVDGQGQPQAFSVIEGFRQAEFPVGAFLDREFAHVGRREALPKAGLAVLGMFSSGASTEHALASSLDSSLLDELLEVGSDVYGRIGDGRRNQLNIALGKPGELAPSALVRQHGLEKVRQAVGDVAHKSDWFKPRDHSRALARWLADGRLPERMEDDLRDFYVNLKLLAGAMGDEAGDGE